MTWFVVLVLLMTLSTALVLFALLPGSVAFAGGGGFVGRPASSSSSSSPGGTDWPGPDGKEDHYHFYSFGSILLQLFSITMGVDYDSFNAVALRPGGSLAQGRHDAAVWRLFTTHNLLSHRPLPLPTQSRWWATWRCW
jgi:hypothetical protein